MTNPTHLQSFGNQIAVLFDDGTKKLAYPTTGDLWIISGAGGGPVPGAGEFVWPFSLDAVSSEYGPREGGAGSFHEGIDFGGGAVGGVGTPIPAVGDGVLSEAYYHGAFGNLAIIDHGVLDSGTLAGKRVKSLYAHMDTSSPLSIDAPTVAGTTVVGPIGNTGGSFGAHLHLEIHVMEPGGNIVWNTVNDSGFRTAMEPRDFFAEYGA